MNIARKLYYALSPVGRRRVRRLVYWPYDTYMSLTRRRDPMVPPKGKIFIGSGDFVAQGRHIAAMLTDLTGMKPDMAVLDVGCGIGRAAVALTSVLSDKGRYEGFDIVRDGIDWCRERITPRHPNFRFTHVDLRNDLYNLSTEAEAADFSFPYPDGSFDRVLLTSVFTHMMPDDMCNYLNEIHRVLRPGGVCLATYFVIDGEALRQMEAGQAYFDFPHDFGHYRLLDANVREADVAFSFEWLRSAFDNAGLSLSAFHRGTWACAPAATAPDFQDVIILTR